MEISPIIKTETDYEGALAEIEQLFEAKPGTNDAERLDVLVTLVESYEDERYPIPLPSKRLNLTFNGSLSLAFLQQFEIFVSAQTKSP
jgi:antitoxin component HigA of HigAB toxin-antitoxin module